ncbi:transcriptional regulator [Pseudonocardia sp. CNS-004]|nr:transcriptional regulator [Pseudonocardia sp. CNS-004]
METEARTELGAFLRRQREQTTPEHVGLPQSGSRRTPGLRREEVAMLAGVGLTWYTWLEQGRKINVSRQVIDAVARVLRMSPAEHEYALHLAGHEGLQRDDGHRLPPHGQHVLDALGSSPAYAIAWDWTIIAWNDAYAALYPTVATTTPDERNLLWLVWTDPTVRDLLPDWPTDSRRFVTMYRAAIGPRLNSPEVAKLVDDLRKASPEFGTAWDSHDVDGFTSRVRTFIHPDVGRLDLEHQQLSFADSPGIHLTIYTAPNRETAAALERLSNRDHLTAGDCPGSPTLTA